MTTDDFLPPGQHRLDPGGPADPVCALLSALWCDLVWTVERAVSVDIHRRDNEPDDEAREFGYLPGDTDDSLQHLARIIELLALGHCVDWSKPVPRSSNPPYFRRGALIPRSELTPVGLHPLDPASGCDALRVLLRTGKESLVRLAEYTKQYRRARRTDSDEADALAHRMSHSARHASDHLARAIELILLGLRLGPLDSTQLTEMRVFKKCTTADWLAAAHPAESCPLLRSFDYGVKVHFAAQKWRWFALACVRRVQHAFTDTRTLALVDAVEREIDGELSIAELDDIWKRQDDPPNADTGPFTPSGSPELQSAHEAFQALAWGRNCDHAGSGMHVAACARAAIDDPAEEAVAQADLLREIFGNPFSVSTPGQELLDWNGGTVVSLARGIHDERAFDRMPILGDALEDAGCTDAEILAHCREQHEHVRWCWVLDLILGRHLLARTDQETPS